MPHTDSNHRRLYRFFPFLNWLRGYQVSTFRNDALAGITVAVVLIPQAMAYAILAGMPPVYGLYAAALTPLIGALWGSLRQLATGPIAIMSLLVLTTLTPLAEPGSKPFIELAFLLALMVGILYLLIGLFRFGLVMFFISHSAVKGFTSAAALIIIATQIPHLHIPTSIIGIVALLTIFGVQKYRKNLPSGLIALVFVTIPVVVFELHLSGVAIVGPIPKGLPHPVIPPFDFETINALLAPAVVIALVSFAETYSVGKVISSQTKQKIDVDQEFIGQGLANIIGSFFQSYPVSGSFSRTALNYATGAKTGISGVISSLSVVLALLFLTPLSRISPKQLLRRWLSAPLCFFFIPKKYWNYGQ